MTTHATIKAIIIDTADPAALARFYAEVTGLPVSYSDDDYVFLGADGGPQLAFQKVADYRAPGWPDPAKHAHLDLRVEDLESAERELLALGAGKPGFQPGEGNWVVLTDPEGHPFCITG